MQNEYKPVQKTTVSENVFTECSEDFILPDYMPEIRRVLKLDTQLIKGESFVGSAKADFDGTVLYTLFYTDNEETLTAVPLESRYHYELPLGAQVPEFVYSEERADSVNMRPCGPRRIFIRTKIHASVHTVIREPLQKALCEILPDDCGAVECLEKGALALHTALCRSEVSEVQTEFLLEGKSSEKIRPVYAKSETIVEKATAENGHVLCRGTVLISVLYEDEGELKSLSRRIPFEDAAVADAAVGDLVSAKGLPSQITLSLSESGEDTVICATATHGFEAFIERNLPVTLITDAYATDKKLSLSTKTAKTTSLCDSIVGNLTVDTELPLCEGTEVPFVSVTPRTVTLAWEGRRAVLEGEMQASLLCYGSEGEEKKHFFALEHTFPFRIEAEGKNDVLPTDLTLYEILPYDTVIAVQNGKGHLSSEISHTLRAYREKEYRVPDTAASEEWVRSAAGEVIVHYPTDKDSLWSVAKEYGIPLSRLCEQNDLSLKEGTDAADRQTLDGTVWLFTSQG